MKALRSVVIAVYFAVAAMPLAWMAVTSFKHTRDTILAQPKYIPALSQSAPHSPLFQVSLEAYRKLNAPYAGTDRTYFNYLVNSVVIGLLSTVASVVLGTFCAYGFSRFRIPGGRDWLFFILSTRFLPPLAVIAPVLTMYRQFDLPNTHLGLVLLYTVFNLSLSVWLMKGFIDDIPRAYEEAALVDGYSRLRAFFLIIIPQASRGMAVTAVFCLIAALNEYGFAMTLNSYRAVTVPVYFAGLQKNIDGIPWPQVAAGVILFVVPVIVFTVLVRRHLLRGVTFGTVKQ
ncbi:MAG: carbohydrate ABC transporter permease [Planctomycetes bacterium]|nr:carbohydrate ABC transporter permease [Planctomycetota bacterium]